MFVIVDHFTHIFASLPPIQAFYSRISTQGAVASVILRLFDVRAMSRNLYYRTLFYRAIMLYPYELFRDYRVCRYHSHQFVLSNSQWNVPQYADISTNRTGPLSPLIIISQRLTTSLINSSQDLQKQNYHSQCDQPSWNHHLSIRPIIFSLQGAYFFFRTCIRGNLCLQSWSCFEFRLGDFGIACHAASKAWSPFTSRYWVLGKDSFLPYFIILLWDFWGNSGAPFKGSI